MEAYMSASLYDRNSRDNGVKLEPMPLSEAPCVGACHTCAVARTEDVGLYRSERALSYQVKLLGLTLGELFKGHAPFGLTCASDSVVTVCRGRPRFRYKSDRSLL